MDYGVLRCRAIKLKTQWFHSKYFVQEQLYFKTYYDTITNYLYYRAICVINDTKCYLQHSRLMYHYGKSYEYMYI